MTGRRRSCRWSAALAMTGLLAACGGAGSGVGEGPGAELVTDLGCVVCHTDEPSRLGPSLHGIWDTEVPLEGGAVIRVDAEYVRSAVTDPAAQVTAGYQATMPQFFLNDEELGLVVDYVRSLSDG